MGTRTLHQQRRENWFRGFEISDGALSFRQNDRNPCVALVIGSNIFPVRWSRLRQRLGIISPLEYLVARYNLPAQQVLAWSGALLKIFDVGAKWTAAAILLQVFANVPTLWGVLLTGTVTLVYSVVGGLWADALTDMSQFVIQVIAGAVIIPPILDLLNHAYGFAGAPGPTRSNPLPAPQAGLE